MNRVQQMKKVQEEGLEAAKNDLLTWEGIVIHTAGGAREPNQNSLFQIANLGTGEIRYVNADLVTQVIKK